MTVRIEVQKREDGLRVLIDGIETGPFINTSCVRDFEPDDYLRPVLGNLCCALFDKAYRLGAESVRKQLRDIINAEP